MNKKAKVKMLLELLQTLENIPTQADGNTMDMEKFGELPEVKAVVTLLKLLKVDAEYLQHKGFFPAYMLLGKFLQ